MLRKCKSLYKNQVESIRLLIFSNKLLKHDNP